MPAYASPTAAQVKTRTGINRYILDQADDATLDGVLASLITDAEAITAAEVTEAVFASTSLTAHQVSLLQQSVSYHAAGAFLVCPEIQRETGTHSPLDMDPGLLDGLANKLHREGMILSFMVSNGDLNDRVNRLAIAGLRGAG